MVGYSGGAIASQWAAELAPAYAAHINLVGTAAGGVFVDPFHSLSFINGNATGWSDVIPVYLILLQRAFGVPVAPYLSPLGVKVYQADENTSISDFTTAGFTTFQQLVKPQYAMVSKVRPFVKALDQLIMGSDGTPKSPMFLGNGEGTKNNGWDGDGIMITDDVEGLAHEYCKRGVPVEFQVYSGLPHVEAFAPFISYAIPYLTDRLNGLPAPSNCASVGPGNSLSPQPIPAAPSRAHGRKHRHRPRHRRTRRHR
jgi:Secretory lipase